jgi:hypothetical protein
MVVEAVLMAIVRGSDVIWMMSPPRASPPTILVVAMARYVFEIHQIFFISFLGFAKSMDKFRID